MNKKYLHFVRLLPMFLLAFVATCSQKTGKVEIVKNDEKIVLPPLKYANNAEVFPPPIEKSKANRPDFMKLYKPASQVYTHSFLTAKIDGSGFCNYQNIKPVIDILFNVPMVDKKKIGLTVKPPFTIEPGEGTFIWKSEKLLQFFPQDYSFHGKKFRIQISNDLKSLTGQILEEPLIETVSIHRECLLGKTLIGWDPVRGFPQIVVMANCDGEWDSKDAFFLKTVGQCIYFDQPISIEKVTEKISLTSGGAPVKFNITERKVPGISKGQVYQIVPQGSFPAGSKIVISADSSLTMHMQSDPKQYPESWFFKTFTMPSPMESQDPFLYSNAKGKIIKKGKNNYIVENSEASFYLKFSNPVKKYSSEEMENLITVTPEVDLTFDIDKDTIKVNGPEKRAFSLRVSEKLQDLYGYSLKSPTTVSVKPVLDKSEIKFPKFKTYEKTDNLTVVTNDITDFTAEFFILTKENIIQGLKLAETGLGSTEQFTSVKIEKKGILKDNQLKTHKFSLKDILKGKGNSPVLFTVSETKPKIKISQNSKSEKYGIVQTSQIACSVKLIPDGGFIWVNNISTMAPLPESEVTIYNEQWKLLTTKKTDENGLIFIKEKDLFTSEKLYFIIEHQKELAYHIHGRNSDIKSWRFNIPDVGNNWSAETRAMIFTEKGIYKPGETISFKAFFRKNSNNQLIPISNKVFTVTLKGPYEDIIEYKQFTTNEFGSISGTFDTMPEGRNGSYELKVTDKDEITSTRVLVTSFRKPKFKVGLNIRNPSILKTEKIKASIDGRYLIGSPMAGAKFFYYIYASSSPFSPPGYEDFSFNLRKDRASKMVRMYEGRLSREGKYKLEENIKRKSSGRLLITIRADVEDLDRQTVTKVSNCYLHPASHYVGVRILDSEPQVNTISNFETITLDHDGKPVTGKNVNLEIYRRIKSWNWESDDSDEYQNYIEENQAKLVGKCKLTGTGEKQTCQYIFDKPGSYVAVAWTKDTQGNIHKSAASFYVSGQGEAGLGRSTFVPVKLQLDKDAYNIGDTGKVLISSPFQSAKILLTVENHGILYKQIRNVQKGVNWLAFPVPAESYPNGFVSVYLLTPRTSDKKDGAGRDLGISQHRIGYAAFSVKSEKYTLGVSIYTSKSKAKPREKVDITVALKSPEKKPVVGEVALMVVDESVLSLTDFKTPDPKKAAFPTIGLNMFASDSRSGIDGELITLYGLTHPGGGGSDEPPKPTNKSSSIRSDFKNTIYFNPFLKTDATGKVSATITLPDNVTTYRIMAVAIDKQSLFGSSSKEIIVNKPLTIEPALPRFLIHGDKIKAGVVAHNMTTKPVKATVTIEAKGIKLLSDTKVSITINPQKPVEIPFEMHAQTLGRAQFTFSIKAENGETDTVQTSIPVNPFTLTRSHSTTGITDKSQSITLDFPKNALTGGTLALEVTSNPLAPLKESVDFLVKYPYGCVEQTTSSTYPLLALMDILPTLGNPKHTPEKLKAMAQKGIYRLSRMMTEEGGLAYWPSGNRTHKYGTAYAMLAINAAVKKGLKMPYHMDKKVTSYLKTELENEEDFLLKAYLSYILAKNNNYPAGHISVLYRSWNRLSVEGKSYLFLAIREGNKNDPRLDILLKKIVEGFDENGEFKEKIKYNDDMFGSPLKTISIALIALLESDKYNSLANKLMNKILDSQKDGYFGTTQQTVFALMALAAYAKKLNLSAEPPAFKVTLDNVQLKLNSSAKTVFFHNFDFSSVIAKGKQKLTITSLKKGKPVFYTLKTKFSETPPKNGVTVYSSGISVYKRIEDVKGNAALEIQGGKLVRVRLFVHIPYSVGNVRYLALDDPLPSGLEAINTDLATSSKVTTGNDTAYNLASYTESNISFKEFREDRVLFFADSIWAGFWEFTYLARATTIGSGIVPPVSAHAMYDPEIHAMSNPSRLTVTSSKK
ncbi:hypothetical protein KKF34_01660 [Myxococcota bacterium]|nr:hypothetical protein [Myxococcota bacterium]MBU1382063.1 hypothetical protein [Myxococcota bacterium]MBU1495565.1 hypothetical protein [Myxococcota bacterium]